MSWLPREVVRRPVVLLDSGQSIDESIWLFAFRRYLEREISQCWIKRYDAPKWVRARVWLVAPSYDVTARYPLRRYWEYRRTRPVRWDEERGLDKRGFFASFAVFEEGCCREKTFHEIEERERAARGEAVIRAPWREFIRPKKRGMAVYLNPIPRDQKWMDKHADYWHHFLRVPVLALGFPWERQLPLRSPSYVEQFWCWDRAAYDDVNRTFHSNRAWHIPWKKVFQEQPVGPKYDFGIGTGWDSPAREVRQGAALNWTRECPGATVCPAGADVMTATDCRVYLVASHREDVVPWDVLIALSRGASVVVPSTKRYKILLKGLPKHRVSFYPVQGVGIPGRLHWDSGSLRAWLKLPLKRLLASWGKPAGSSTRTSGTPGKRSRIRSRTRSGRRRGTA